MMHISSPSHDPCVNLAMEEFLVREHREDFVVTYLNSPSVVVGKHQNPFAECDLRYAEEHDIKLVRRLSGGGTVYHDSGNLNFALITEHRPERHNRYEWFLEPVIQLLQHHGVEAEISHRNSLVVNGHLKVSGTAQFASRGRMLSHGTLLVRADLQQLRAVLVDTGAFFSGISVPSVRSSVVNLADLADSLADVEAVRNDIAKSYAASQIETRDLRESEWKDVNRLADHKYRSWDWNYGRTPSFTATHTISSDEERTVLVRVQSGIVISVSDEHQATGSAESGWVNLLNRRYDELILNGDLRLC